MMTFPTSESWLQLKKLDLVTLFSRRMGQVFSQQQQQKQNNNRNR